MHANEVRDCPIMVYFNICGHFHGQTGETAQSSFFGLNQCAIAHSFEGGPKVWVCRWPNIDSGVPGRLGIILV